MIVVCSRKKSVYMALRLHFHSQKIFLYFPNRSLTEKEKSINKPNSHWNFCVLLFDILFILLTIHKKIVHTHTKGKFSSWFLKWKQKLYKNVVALNFELWESFHYHFGIIIIVYMKMFKMEIKRHKSFSLSQLHPIVYRFALIHSHYNVRWLLFQFAHL